MSITLHRSQLTTWDTNLGADFRAEALPQTQNRNFVTNANPQTKSHYLNCRINGLRKLVAEVFSSHHCTKKLKKTRTHTLKV